MIGLRGYQDRGIIGLRGYQRTEGIRTEGIIGQRVSGQRDIIGLRDTGWLVSDADSIRQLQLLTLAIIHNHSTKMFSILYPTISG